MANRGFAWRGRRACQCVIDATEAYEALTKGSLTKREIYQGSYSWAKKSAGTHGKGGALDTVSLSDGRIKVASAIGFWPCNRVPPSFDPHAHWVLFGCPHAAGGLRKQERELRAGRNALKSGRPDPHKRLRPEKIVTFMQWSAQRATSVPPTFVILPNGMKLRDRRMTVVAANVARRKGKRSIYTYWVQRWLRKTKFYVAVIDAKWGPVTQAALDNFRRSLGWPEKDCIGPIGVTSAARLAKAARTSKHVFFT